MTEQEWLASTDLTSMVEYVRGKGGQRKLRLLACAFARGIQDIIRDMGQLEERARDMTGSAEEHSTVIWEQAVKCAEQYADGAASEQERIAAQAAVSRNIEPVRSLLASVPESHLEDLRGWVRAMQVAVAILAESGDAAASEARDVVAFGPWRRRMFSYQEAVLRDVFGNPFVNRKATRMANLPTPILNLARLIYTDRAFDRLPLLADALEDAGCTDADILAHCRGPGPHVRGCWVLDNILGRD